MDQSPPQPPECPEPQPAPAQSEREIPPKTSQNWWRHWLVVPLLYLVRGLELFFSKPKYMATAAVILVLCLAEWRSTTAIIDNFEISSALSKDGITPAVVSHTLDLHLKRIQEVAGTAMPRRALAVDKPPEFVIPGTGVSLGYLVGQAKRFLSGSQLRVGGAVVTLNNRIQTIVRVDISEDKDNTYSDTIDGDRAATCAANRFALSEHTRSDLAILDAQLSCAAEFVMKYTQPYVLAVYHQEIGDVKAAKELAQFILYHPPKTDDYWALNLLGSIALSEAQQSPDDRSRNILLKQAESYFDRSEQLFDELAKNETLRPFALTHVNRGVLYAYRKDYERAKTEYKVAIKKDPSYGTAYSNLAGLVAREAGIEKNESDKKRLMAEADRFYQEGRDHAADLRQKAMVLTNWGRSLASVGRTSDALGKIEEAIAADSTNAEAYILRGDLLKKGSEQNLASVADAYSVAAKLRPWRLDYVMKSATALRDVGRIEESIAELERPIKRKTIDVGLMFEYARVLVRSETKKSERYKAALDAFYQAYDLRMKSNPYGNPAKSLIEEQIRQFVGLYCAMAAAESGNVGSDSDRMNAQVELLLVVGHRFVDGGYFAFANGFYGDALMHRPTTDLKDKIVAKLQAAAARTMTPEARFEAVNLAWSHKQDDESLLQQRFMLLIDRREFEEARSFAVQRCDGKAKFEAIAKKWFPPPWECERRVRR